MSDPPPAVRRIAAKRRIAAQKGLPLHRTTAPLKIKQEKRKKSRAKSKARANTDLVSEARDGIYTTGVERPLPGWAAQDVFDKLTNNDKQRFRCLLGQCHRLLCGLLHDYDTIHAMLHDVTYLRDTIELKTDDDKFRYYPDTRDFEGLRLNDISSVFKANTGRIKNLFTPQAPEAVERFTKLMQRMDEVQRRCSFDAFLNDMSKQCSFRLRQFQVDPQLWI